MSGWTLAARGLTYKIGSKALISGVSCTLPAGKVTAIIGPSGSGKSTLLRCLGSSYKPSAGEVTADGQKLKELGDARSDHPCSPPPPGFGEAWRSG